MSLKEKITEDLKEALRKGEEQRKSTLRMLQSAIRYREVELQHPLSDEEVLDVIAKQVKQRRESIAEYEKGGREDLVREEQGELDVLSTYLPEQLSREEIRAMAQEAIKQTGATDARGIGAVMKELMPKVRGRAEGRVVNEIVRDLLNE